MNINLLKKYIGLLARSFVILIICAALGFVLLLGVFFLPANNIEKNVAQSSATLLAEGDYPAMFSWCFSQQDNWTDATILSNTAYDGEEDLVEKTLCVYRYRVNKDGEELSSCESLAARYSEDPEITLTRYSYARYWHGYLIVTKLLFSLFDLDTVRVINTVTQALLLLTVLGILWKKKCRFLMLPFIFTWGILVPPLLGSSLQFSTIYYVFMIGCIILLLNIDKWKNSNGMVYYFLVMGAATSYFDFLTYPLATLGIPLAVYFALEPSGDLKKNCLKLVQFCLFWGIGYGGMWACKWILASILTEENVIANALELITLRTSNEDTTGTEFSLITLFVYNMRGFVKNQATLAAIVYCICMGIYALAKGKLRLNDVVIFGVIAISPFAWYFVTQNHSYVHWWFTCKALIVTAFAGVCMLNRNLHADDKSMIDKTHL